MKLAKIIILIWLLATVITYIAFGHIGALAVVFLPVVLATIKIK